MNAGELLGTIGVSLLLIAFALNIANKISATSKLYLLLNIAGAALAGISSYLIDFMPFVILESVWAISSVVVLFKSINK